MKLEIGSTYIINVETHDKLGNLKVLTYEATILECDENSVTFKDKYDKEYIYNLNNIIVAEKNEN